MSSGVCAVDVVGLLDWDSVGRSMVDWNMVNRSMLNRGRGMVDWDMLNRGMVDRSMVDRSMVSRDGVGWLVVDGDSVGRLLLLMVVVVVVGSRVLLVDSRVLWGGGASLVRPRVVREPGRLGHVLNVGNIRI